MTDLKRTGLELAQSCEKHVKTGKTEVADAPPQTPEKQANRDGAGKCFTRGVKCGVTFTYAAFWEHDTARLMSASTWPGRV